MRVVNVLVAAVASIGLTAPSMAPAQQLAPGPSVTMEIEIILRNATRPVMPAGPTMSMQRTIPLPSLVAGLQSRLPYRNMNYIGVERFDPQSGIYALRFLNGRQVIVVIVDGRSGRILDRGF